MKKTLFAAVVLSFVGLQFNAALAQTPDVTIKRGKATMDEAYYYQLKQKADAFSKMEQQNNLLKKSLDDANAELKKKQAPKISTFNDSASYAIGKDIATSWQQQKLGINLEVVAQSLIDMAKGKNNWSRQTMNPILQRFQREFEQRQQKKQQEMMASLDKNKEEGAKFLKENANNKSVYTTKSGLQYRKLKDGNGKRPTANSTVKVHGHFARRHRFRQQRRTRRAYGIPRRSCHPRLDRRSAADGRGFEIYALHTLQSGIRREPRWRNSAGIDADFRSRIA